MFFKNWPIGLRRDFYIQRLSIFQTLCLKVWMFENIQMSLNIMRLLILIIGETDSFLDSMYVHKFKE